MNRPELHLTRPPSPLEPGRISRGRLLVRNAGPEVERFDLAPTGPLSEWTSLSETEVRLWPGDEREVGVSVELPLGSRPVAGETVLGVTARAQDGATAAAHQPATVAPRFSVEAQAPVPHAIRTPRRALVHVPVTNTGNAPLGMSVAAQDRAGALRQEVGPQGYHVMLEAGQSAFLPIVLRCVKPIWWGRPAPREYAVDVVADQARAGSNGVVTQVRVVPLVLAALLVLCVILIFGFWGEPEVIGWAILAVGLLFVTLGAAISRLFQLKRDRTRNPH